MADAVGVDLVELADPPRMDDPGQVEDVRPSAPAHHRPQGRRVADVALDELDIG
jgi:hypothetical protein